jgi:hypothetical protein
MSIQKAPKGVIRKTEGRDQFSSARYETPRIGNRSDALDLLDRIIEGVDDIAGSSDSTGEISQWAISIGVNLEVLRDAIEREIL